MDLAQTFLAAGLALVGSAVGYLINKVIATDRTLTAHIASDTVMFQQFLLYFNDLRTEMRDQSMKLDRLIERTPNVGKHNG